MFKVAVLCGSLRKASTNAGLLRSILNYKDSRFQYVWINIHDFPIFNEDVEAQGIPAPVQIARKIIAESDVILFGVPQYNFSVSSPLKNAYDWISREDKDKFCPVTNKIGAMVSSGGGMGGGRAQEHFRQIVGFRKMVLLTPSKQGELLVKRFSGKVFDQQGNLIDQEVIKRIPLFLNQFASFIQNNKK